MAAGAVMSLMMFLGATAAEIKIGILADDARGPLGSGWQRTVDYLSRALPEHTFVLEPLSYEELLAALKKQKVDAAIVDPAVPILAGARAVPVATPRYRFRNQEFYGCAGALVVRTARADLRTWSDLRRAEIATAGIHSLADWLAARRELKSVRWTGRVHACSSRKAALDAVASGRVEAAALPAGVLEMWQAIGWVTNGAYHVIAAQRQEEGQAAEWPVAVSTRTYPGLAFVIADRGVPEYQRQLAVALLSMPAPSDGGDNALSLLGWAPYGSDAEVHMALRDLGLFPYHRMSEISLAHLARRYTYVLVSAGLVFIVGLGIIVTLAALNRTLWAEVVRRREAEQALLRSIERFEHIAVCSSDWIWECDERGAYTYSNANVRSMLGYDPQEILGQHHLEFVAALDRERLLAEGRSLLDGGRRVFREVYRMRTKDGRLVVHEITAEPVRGSDGKVIGYRGVNRDITDRARGVRLVT